MKFTQKDINRIHKEISAAEENTSAEIVVVVAEKSDDYKYVPLLWSALIGFAIPLPLFYFAKLSGPDIYLIQLSVFCIFSLLLSLPFIIIHVVPNPLKKIRCHRQAREQFLTQNLHTTKGRTGILIYVSLCEKYCEILADEGIYQKLDKQYWEDQVETLTGYISKGETVVGLVAVIKSCGSVLSEHYPAGKENPNELPNHLILL